MAVKQSNKDVLLTCIAEKRLDQALLFWLQPIIDVPSRRCCGAEVLVRGCIDGELIFPDDFIPELEANGDICLVGVYMYEQGLRYAKLQGLDQRPWFLMSFNFSPIEMNTVDIVEKIKMITDAVQYPYTSIIIEITETDIPLTLLGRSNANQLKQMSFCLAWDDIQSIADLDKNDDRFTAHVVKLDRSLFLDNQLILMHDIIAICRKRGWPIIAEGIEEAWQHAWLVQEQVCYCQGYHFSRPIPPERFTQQYLSPLHTE
ncbi:EAL domain-containing protein [Kluyvera sichuanensis]